MFDKVLAIMTALANLTAVNEYLRLYGNTQICEELDSVSASLSEVLSNLKNEK